MNDSKPEETESMKQSMKTGILSAFTAGVIALGLSFTPARAHALSLKVSSDGVSVTCLSGTPGCGGCSSRYLPTGQFGPVYADSTPRLN